MLSFLDAFSGLHHIPMHLPDTEKNSLHYTARAVLLQCDAFGLKNVGVTYNRLVTKMFRPLLGKPTEVYIDDMLVNSKECPDQVGHL